MPTGDGSLTAIMGILLVLGLVFANGFFVASEFSLVAIRRSRVAELVAAGRINAAALQRAVDRLDANLAACQLGITISSLALGWLGEPALAHLIEPLLFGLPGSLATAGSHAIAIAIAFIIITTLHIVLGELMPKSLALQRSEGTALWIVRPLNLFRLLFWPAIFTLNGLGNLLLRLCGLRPGSGEDSVHSPEELKLLITASQEAGILQQGQQEVVERVFTIGNRPISSIMTPRPEVDWINIDDSHEEILQTIRACQHDQLLVSKGRRSEPWGIILKKDLLDQVLDGEALSPTAVIREPLAVHESAPIFTVLEQFKKAPVHVATILDEYGVLQGIVTQTDLLEAIAGDLPDVESEEPDVIERADGSLLIDGLMSAQEAFDRLRVRMRPPGNIFHTIAGFALFRLGHVPSVGEHFDYEGWHFEIMDMDGRRIDKLLAKRRPIAEPLEQS